MTELTSARPYRITQAHLASSGEAIIMSNNTISRFLTWRSLSTLITSSAKDQLTETSVAIKKIMKPFSTPVLSKRTYRELKLLKHIQHENVGGSIGAYTPTSASQLIYTDRFRLLAYETFLYRRRRICEHLVCVSRSCSLVDCLDTSSRSCWELTYTDC